MKIVAILLMQAIALLTGLGCSSESSDGKMETPVGVDSVMSSVGDGEEEPEIFVIENGGKDEVKEASTALP